MTKDQLISVFLIALLVFVIYQIIEIFSPFMRAIFWSAILAFMFYPAHRQIKKMVSGHETIASIFSTIFVFLVVLPPVIILIVNVTEQAIWLYQYAGEYIREGKLTLLIDDIRALPFTQRLKEQVFEWDIVKNSLEEWLLTSTKSLGNFTAAQVGMITKNLFFVILNILMMFFLTFAFFKDGQKMLDFFYDILPMEEKTKRFIAAQITGTFAAVIRGQILTSLIQGGISGIIFWALGLPVPILFATATFIISMLPAVGASGVWVPVAIYLFFQQEYTKALILTILGMGIISLIDNLLKPVIIGERTKLPYFLLLFGILGGVTLYGMMGIFLAPVILSLFFSLIHVYQEKYR